jgi:hypothetical protein
MKYTSTAHGRQVFCGAAKLIRGNVRGNREVLSPQVRGTDGRKERYLKKEPMLI